MENTGQATAAIGIRREPSTDPVKAQGILNAVTRKSKQAARLWPQRWSFYYHIREIQEEEAQKLDAYEAYYPTGHMMISVITYHQMAIKSEMSPMHCQLIEKRYTLKTLLKDGFKLDEYRASLRSVSCQPEKEPCPVVIDPSPTALPSTSSGMIGYRSKCPLERYGRLVKTSCDYPTRPPLPAGQIYDPYKQTIIFLGGGSGDPISYKLPLARSEVTHEMWARPQQLAVTRFDFNSNMWLETKSSGN